MAVAEYTDRVTDILQYAEDHPITTKGVKMSYESFDALDQSRLPDVVEGLQREDVVQDFESGSDRGSRINRPDFGKRQQHLADVTVGMLYLTCGGLDEAHDLVLPHSWPSPTEQGGAPVSDTEAATEASYCHALVHRREGEWIGEVSMSGWDNSCFWFGRTGYHDIYQQVRKKALAICRARGDEKALMALERNKEWDPDAFTALCRAAVANGSRDTAELCAEVTNMEWRMLFDQCYKIVNNLG